MTIKYFADSVIGPRKKNDDRVHVLHEQDVTLALLCDGIGSHYLGDVAASVVVDTFSKLFNETKRIQKVSDAKKWIYQSINQSKESLKEYVIPGRNSQNLGTTAVGALILKSLKTILFFNVGDSRAYVLKKDKDLVQVTVDQNLENQLLKIGKQPDVLEMEQLKSLTSAISPGFTTTIEVYEIQKNGFENISKILLTSDGIHGVLSKNEIEFLLNKPIPPRAIVQELIENANYSNPTDNMSAIVVEFFEDLELGANNEYK
ncbi:PP2C family protein-serine/threonine phosphatase [Mycoplasma nasistruthionis]|uniref:Serine/threonine-protein phosphatase n=1 Tax=Mycoplasma nasistruthionis TaxID=353852 RepID=A0A4Y6I5Z1_9MOLU|nr:PP2C family serine/threonine-protein phosphatase [Mycoplasma nasistruthionis]QCZ36762.1 serine/threonine-protein phosphatase [Mycoplasma nasistruthionis]QDF65045.1 serine/threonine-protein phosphatase [Mycoplasma nasistruthionis]